jgi:hypothetical protein
MSKETKIMKTIRSGFLIGLIVGALFSMVMANASEHNAEDGPDSTLGFKISGHHYLPKGSNFRVGYVVGSLDAFLLAVHFKGTGEQVYDFNNCKDNWTQHELIVIVERYMRENQDERHHSAALLSLKALKAECQSRTSQGN